MSEKQPEKKSKISPEVKTLSERIKEHLKIDGGAISDGEETAYAATLPNNLTMELVRTVEDHNKVFIPAAKLALGQMANEAIAKDENLQTVHGKIAFGATNEIRSTTDRTSQYSLPSSDGTTIKESYKGTTNVVVHITAADRKNPIIKEIRESLREDAKNRW